MARITIIYVLFFISISSLFSQDKNGMITKNTKAGFVIKFSHLWEFCTDNNKCNLFQRRLIKKLKRNRWNVEFIGKTKDEVLNTMCASTKGVLSLKTWAKEQIDYKIAKSDSVLSDSIITINSDTAYQVVVMQSSGLDPPLRLIFSNTYFAVKNNKILIQFYAIDNHFIELEPLTRKILQSITY